MGMNAVAPIPAIPEGIPRSDAEDASVIFGALAPSTRKSYECHIRQFARAGYRLTGRDLVRWISDRQEAGKSPNTIKQGVGAIRKFAAALDLAFSPREIMLIQAALKQACRENRGQARGSVSGAGWEISDRAAEKASRTGDWRGYRDAAIIRITSDALLRVSETSAIDVEDITAIAEGMGKLLIKSSKTDQEGIGAYVYLGEPTMESIRKWLDISGIENGALFRVERGECKGRRIGPQGIHFMLQRRLRAAGAEGRLGGHSLRRGSAASLVRAGASLVEVQDAGRWVDPRCVRTYVTGQLGERGVLARYRYGKE